MKTSIITVCFNSESTIEDTINSVISQDYDDIEYIIIDGGSKDNTLKIIERYSDFISKVISEPDKGIYDAMNKGLKLATGEIIGILNSDDIFVSSQTISEVIKRIKGSPEEAIFYGEIAIVERDNIEIVKRRYAVDKFTTSKLKLGIMPPHPATFIPKSIYEKISNYRTEYKIAADFELYARASIKFGLPVKNLGLRIVNMREGGVSTSGLNFFKISSGEMAKALRENGVNSHSVITSLRLPLKWWSKVSGNAL